MATAARIRHLRLSLLGFEPDHSASGGIRAEEGRVDPVAVVGVGPRRTVVVGDEDTEVERPWRGVGVGEGGDAEDGREEWATEVRRGPRAV
jgi:hypothetical protein